MAGVVFVEDFWLVSAGFPSVSRNRDAYQSIDQQDESSSPANPFNQAQDSKPARTYWESQAVKNAVFSSDFLCSSTVLRGNFKINSTSLPVFCTVGLLQIAALKTNWILL